MTSPSEARFVQPDLVAKCDELSDACDTLLDGCEASAANLDHVQLLARQLELQTLYLYEAQAKLELEREAFARMLFWSQLSPSAIQARIAQTFAGKRRP